MATKSIGCNVDADLYARAQKVAGGAGPTETVRQALTHFASTAPAAAAAVAAVPRGATAAAQSLSQMSDADKAATLTFLTKSRQAMRDALAYFAGDHAIADSAEKKRLRIEIADLEADLLKMNARIAAVIAGELTMAPPPQATVDKIAGLATEVQALTLQAQSADKVVSAAESVAKIWSGAVP